MKYFTLLKTLAASACLLFFQHSVLASSASSPELETIIVTATRSDQAQIITPHNINIISSNEIEKMGSSSLIDILRSKAGVQISDFIGNGSRAAISLRGFGANAANNTLVMIDGRKLNNASLEAPLLNTVSVSDIERIEIIQGSGGVLYGDQAVGGVINIITKKAGKEPYYHLGTRFGSDDLQAIEGTASQRFESGFAYRVSVEDKKSDNFRDNNDANYVNYLVRIDQQGDIGEIFAESQYIDDELRLPGALTQAQVNADRTQASTPNDFSNRQTDMVRLGGTLYLFEGWRLLAEATDRDTDGAGFIFGDFFQQNTRTKSFSPRIVGDFLTGQGEAHLTVGHDVQHSEYNYNSTSIWATLKDSKQNIDSIYAQLIYPLIQGLSLTAGARESTMDFSDKLLAIKNTDTEATHEIGLNWTPHHTMRLYLRQADILRFPNADDNGLTLPGVAYLDAQTGSSRETGFEINHHQWGAGISLFDMEIDNEIYFDSFLFANINLPKSKRRGIILNGDYQITDSISAAANYTFTSAKVAEGSFSGEEVPFVSKDLGAVSINWQITPALSLYSDAIYTGSRYKYDDDANSSARINPYWVYNMALRWEHRNLETTLRLNNITGEEYSSLLSSFDYQYPVAEETVELVIGYTF